MNKRNRNISIFRLATLAMTCLGLTSTVANAVEIAGTDFSGRTVNGDTAENITWTTNGVDDPGDLTAVEVGDTAPIQLNGLFDTANAQGHFAPDLNVANEDSWFVDIPLDFSPGTASIEIEDVVIDWQHFNNSGNFQSSGINRPLDWIVDLVGSTSGTVDSSFTNTGSGGFGVTTVTFGTPTTLTTAETWTLRLTADSTTTTGNNTGIDELTINGIVTAAAAVPEPSTFVLSALGLMSLGFVGWRRRSR